MNIYNYPYNLAFKIDGILNLEEEITDNYGGTYGVIIFLNVKYGRLYSYNRIERVAIGVIESMASPVAYMYPWEVLKVIKTTIARGANNILYYYLAALELRMKKEDFKMRIAVKKIINAWKETISNPSYLLCKQRLTKEFEDLCQESECHLLKVL